MASTEYIPEKYKVVLLGDTNVGKSSILSCLVQSRNPVGKATVSATSTVHTIAVGNKNVSMEIWDTAGQDRFRTVLRMYYRKARAVLVVYDITKSDSYEVARQWVQELWQEPSTMNAFIALVGNKVDRADNRAVRFQEAANYAKWQELLFMETSAKTGENVAKVFQDIAEQLTGRGGLPEEQEGFQLKAYVEEDRKKRSKKRCCS